MTHPFVKPLTIRFRHCDPAGIVFYPRYFEMINDLVEDWCDEGLGMSFERMHMEAGLGVPTANVECRFSKPSRLGETITRTLAVERLGTSSMTLAIRFAGVDDDTRLTATLVLVWVAQPDGRPVAVPDDIRMKIAAFEAAKNDN
ncbi:4-hydroxybenzoyl-CoA thioesterase [Pandoraea terrae]|uniref:4-hydroxybenzoyl-CoA thioesterase n=1 Tax=Pandoraea terrae TaxID=1537710 RepID=A0A5E4ZFS8_9BURK|nr:thioesterase family protein [Pandoraea terrae]VVE59362.1 4-hydroxybenzoyl-CoA thioesterase [Pandoraea terrae]